MKYNLIFYLAKKTSYCEKALRKALEPIGGEAHLITNATSPVELGAQVSRSLRICPLTVIIGGFNSYEDDNLRTVLSRVFSNSPLTLENMRRLSSQSGGEGYIVRDRNQILLAFPDNPSDVTEMCSDELLAYMSDKLGTNQE